MQTCLKFDILSQYSYLLKRITVFWAEAIMLFFNLSSPNSWVFFIIPEVWCLSWRKRAPLTQWGRIYSSFLIRASVCICLKNPLRSEINHILTLKDVAKCANANSALSFRKSLVFALSPFTVKVPAAISSSPSPSRLMVCLYTAAVHGSHPSRAPSALRGGGGRETGFVPPSAGLFYSSALHV